MGSNESFDLVVVGSGFGSLFFVKRYLLDHPGTRALLLEWGEHVPFSHQVEQGANGSIPASETYRDRPGSSGKVWNFTLGLGGGTNCWFAQTPRPQPSDLKLASLYGRGQDWPFDYDSLEPYLTEAEYIMSVSGDPDIAIRSPRSAPFPQPPHRMSTPDRAMKDAYPDLHFTLPTARARVATETRPPCCANLTCNLCPTQAKFIALNDIPDLFDHPSLTIRTGARVTSLEAAGNVVRSVRYERNGREHRASADLVVLGANAVHSPAILIASGLGGGLVGQGLHESVGASVEVKLHGMRNFDGSTITTGLNYAFADGEFRRDRAAAVLFFENRWMFGLRAERGRWQESLPIVIIAEELVDNANTVTLGKDGVPEVNSRDHSDYARAGIQHAFNGLDDLLAPLPVEDIRFHGYRPTESHLQGTLRMGSDPQTSVVDANLIHHRLRNLVVVGSSTFASCLNANPSLTVAALSLRAADNLAGSA